MTECFSPVNRVPQESLKAWWRTAAAPQSMAASWAKVSGAVRLDRQQVVGTVRLDDGAQVDILEQRAQGGDLAALVPAAAARERPAGVRDQRHGLEVGAVGVAVRAADPHASHGRATSAASAGMSASSESRRGPSARHVLQGVRVGVRHHPADRRVRRRDPAPLGAAPRAHLAGNGQRGRNGALAGGTV